MDQYQLFTSESVSEGHPDKLADQVSDAVLDALLKEDPHARVAVETLAKTGFVIVAGEVSTSAYVDLERLVRKVITEIGYDHSDKGFDGHSCGVLNAIGGQSQDIAMGVDEAKDKALGAGDQGLMFGFACKETKELMPLPISLSHRLMQKQAELRKSGQIEWLRPDAKSQVTLRYSRDGEPLAVDTVLISTQHEPSVSQDEIKEAVIESIIKPTIPSELLLKDTRFLVNPTGRFIVGGPMGDCGLTGRKIIVDTYGGMARHGGGCFSGKDPSKVDRSAAYAARYVAKNIVAADLADKCEVQLSYAIGVAEPTSIRVETFGTGKTDDIAIEQLVREHFDLTPQGIIDMLDLRQPIYQPTAAYGHFGREDAGFGWEKTDKVELLV